jgi:pilus assembly protein CpaF
MEGESITMHEIFNFRQTGLSADKGVEGYFSATGVRPVFLERLQAFGIRLADGYFDPNRRYS